VIGVEVRHDRWRELGDPIDIGESCDVDLAGSVELGLDLGVRISAR
jgi:hypothetical protein